MWMMILLLPMAYLIAECIRAFPKKYRRIPAAAGWTMAFPCLIALTIPGFAWIFKTQMPLLNAMMVLLAALACYYFIRGVSFLGIVASYFSYDRDHKTHFPPACAAMAWALSLLEPVAVVFLLCLSLFFEYPGRMDGKGIAEVMIFLTTLMTFGIALSFIFLMWTRDQRTQLLSGAKPSSHAVLPRMAAPSPASAPRAAFKSSRMEPPPAFKPPSAKMPPQFPGADSQKPFGGHPPEKK